MNVLIFSTFHLHPLFLGLNLEFIQKNSRKQCQRESGGQGSDAGFGESSARYL
jgi:hypothetical protein